MKGKNYLTKVISMFLAFALLSGLLPASALAAGTGGEPDISEYKGMSMIDLSDSTWISRFETKSNPQKTSFFNPVSLVPGRSLVRLAYTIQSGQYISLELYRFNADELSSMDPRKGNGGTWVECAMPYNMEPAEDPENPDDPYEKEPFLGQWLGYLNVTIVDDNIENKETPGADGKLGNPTEISDATWRERISDFWAGGVTERTSTEKIYGYGWQGDWRFLPDDESQTNEVSALDLVADQDFVQNFLLWDGSLINKSGALISSPNYSNGYYVIVLTSLDKRVAAFNVFLGFEINNSKVKTFDINTYHEPEKTVEEYAKCVDPVDLITGSFSWNYTDFSLFGNYDLPFTRYYESVDAGNNYGLGNGWSTDYTAHLETQTLFAQVTLPRGQRITFDLQPDGSYKQAGDYTFSASGNGYFLTNVKENTVRYFDAQRRLQSIRYADGNVVSFTWNGEQMTGVSNSSGSFSLSYNGDGNLSSVTDSAGRSITLSYAGDKLTSVENPDGDSLIYTYDANGYLSTVKNFKGQIYVENTYDAAGRVVHQYAANIGTFDFAYDPDARHNVCTGTDGYFLGVWYNERGWLVRRDDPQGSMYFTWDDHGQKTSQTDRAGNTTLYEHDAAGNISRITYPDGTTEQMVYNADRRVTSFTDRGGNTTTMTYNGPDCTSVTDARGNTTTYAYDNNHNVISMTDALGNTTGYTYDANGNRTSITDALGNVTEYSYDSQGRLTKVTDAQGNETSYQYTDAGKLVKITDAQGNVQTYTVDGNGFNTSESDWMAHLTTYERNTQNQITRVTDALGNETVYTYDARGNRVTSTDANGNTTAYGYDAAGRMTSMTDAAGNTWSYTYNANGQMVSVTDPAGGVTSTAYDAAGRTSSTTGANGGVTRYTYDGAGRTTGVTDALNKTTTKTYDANGNLTSVTDRNGKTTTYTYDAANRLTSVTDALNRTTTYTYDALGRVTKTTTPGGSESTSTYDSLGWTVSSTDALGHVTGYTYDTLGRVTQITYADSSTVAYTYNANGQVLTVTDQLGGVTAYAYDALGRVTSVTDPMDGVTAYTYDAMGNVLTMTDPMGFVTSYTYNSTNNVATVTAPDGGVVRYAYDSLGRVSQITDAVNGVTKYTYDASGNLTKVIDAQGGVTTYTYDLLGRQTGMTDGRGNTWTYAYDNEGRLVSTTDPLEYTTSKTYDAAGQLISETDANGNTWSYTYDADGRMTAKTDPLGNQTLYTYDANGNLLKTTTALERETAYTYDALGRVTKATDPMGHAVTFLYDAKGQLVGLTNADGTTVSYSYDANGNVLTATDEAGSIVRYTYDADGRQTSVTNALGHKTDYAYDSVGNLIKQTDALGGETTWSYDKNGNLLSTTDPNGNTTSYTYDKLGRVLTATDPNGGVVSAQYDANGNITKITDAENNVTTYTYDALNRLSSYTDAEGYTFSYTYDGNGNVLTYTDGNGNVTRYTYDGLNRAVSRTDAAGNVASNTYDADGRMIKAVDEEGAVTLYAYDDCGRLTSMTDALGHVTAFEYDAMDRVTKVTDALGNSTTYTYNAVGDVASQTNANGVTTTYTYDANDGNLTSVTDAAGTASYAYDALDRVISVTDRRGNTQTFTYDAGGRITKVTDKNGNETAYTYDGNGNIIKTTDALGTEVLFQYDANDQLIKMTQNRVDEYHEQAEQLVTLYEYDGRNLVTKVVQATGSQELYVYDGNGNIVSKTDGDNYVTEYTYNSLDLVTHISYNGTKEVSYQYNKVGELVRMDDWLGTTTFQLDLLNQLKKVTDHKGNVVEYTYDAVGNQTSITYPDETEVSKSYDALGQLLQVTDAENQNYTYTYDDAGNVTKLVYPNGWVEDYTYDAEGNLLKTVDTDPFHNNKVSTKYQYTYDAEGNLISEYKRDTTAGNKALTTTYAYDALNRLVSAHEEGVGVNTTRTYQYDTLGNLIREEQDGCVEYKYNGAHLDESTKCGTIPNSIGTSYWEYTYDNRGNLVSRDKYTRTTSGMAWQNEAAYTYDETNRLVQGKNEDGEVSRYTYNGLGMRVGRELIMKDNTHGCTDFHDLTPSVDTGIDKPEVVKESYVIDYTSATFDPLTMDEDGGFSYRYVYGLNTLSVKITSEGTNWWGQHVTTDILKDYYHQDRLGSTTNLTDKFGRVVGRADYDEWGQVTYKEALSITSSYRRIWPQLSYTGHDYDDVLDLYYAKARFYSADDKRFVSMDPIKGEIVNPLSLVSYVYCVDNPLRWVDPLGLVMGRPGNTNLELTDTGNWSAAAHTDNQGPQGPQIAARKIDEEVAKALSRQTLDIVSSAASLFGGTAAFTIGFASGIAHAIEDLTIGNLVKLGEHLKRVNTARNAVNLSPVIYSSSDYERYLDSTDSAAEWLAELTGHPDAFYAGRMVADVLMQAVGIAAKWLGTGATAAGLKMAVTGGSAALFGTLSGTAAVAIAGAAELADGMIIAVGGVAVAAAGEAVSQAAAERLGRDAAKYKEYQDKAGCEGSGGTHDPKVDYDGRKCSVYRGGDDFTIDRRDIRTNKDGTVRTTHGLSVNVDPNADAVVNRGGAYRIDYLPDGLKIIQRGGNPGHFEIVPAYEMPMDQFQQLLNQIKVTKAF